MSDNSAFIVLGLTTPANETSSNTICCCASCAAFIPPVACPLLKFKLFERFARWEAEEEGLIGLEL